MERALVFVLAWLGLGSLLLSPVMYLRERPAWLLPEVILAGWLGLGIVMGVVLWILAYRRRWYYWRGGNEMGTFSAHQLHQLYKTAQIGPKTPIRQVKDDRWHTGVAVEDPPPRIFRGLRFAVYGACLGFLLGYFLFGQPFSVSIIFAPPPEEVARLELAALVPNPLSSGASRILDKLDEMRTRILVTAGAVAFLGAIAGGATASGRAKIFKERLVVFKKRGASEAADE